MADLDVDSTFGFVDKRVARGVSGATVLTESNNFDNINDMRPRLAAINGTYYTAARLNVMTRNDMVYALRREGDPTGIN